MDLTAALSTLQAEAESRMSDTCRITRSSLAGEDLDPVTWLPVAGARSVVYTGPCRLRTGGSVSAGSQRQSAGDTVTQVASVLSVPSSAGRVKVDDVVEMLSSVNPSLPQVLFTVSGLIPGSQMTAQRVQVTAVID